MTVRDALIVAGGRGTRLQPLTYTTPKPLLPFCGQPFLAGVLARLAAADVERVHLVVGADTAPFAVLQLTATALGLALDTVPEPEPLDTAGGVRSVLDRLAGPCLVLNGDVLTDVDLRAVAAAHGRTGADATLVLHRVDDTSPYGVCVRDGDRITRFVEKPAPGTLPGQDAVNAGTYVLDPRILAAHPPGPLSFERDVFPRALADGRHLHGFVWDGAWADLGTPERFRAGHRLALHGELAWPTLDGLPADREGRRTAPDATVARDADLVGPVLVLPGARIAAGAIVGPDVVVGPDVTIDAGAVLRDSILFGGARIGAGVTAEGLIAGHRAEVAAGAQLGVGVTLGDDEVVHADDEVPDGHRVPAATG